MLNRELNKLIHLLLCLMLVCGPVSAIAAESFRLVIETNLPDVDSSRLTMDLKEMTYADLADLPARMNGQGHILPGKDQELEVFVFVPASLSAEEQSEFTGKIESQMREAHPLAKFTVKAIEISADQAERDQVKADEDLTLAAAEIQKQDGQDYGVAAAEMKAENQKTAREVRSWSDSFRAAKQKYFGWMTSGKKMEFDEGVGGLIGITCGMSSALVWFNANRFSVSTLMQASASFGLDWFFKKYGRKVNIFKGAHKLPGEQIPYTGRVIQFYNDRPLLKTWIVDNLIGFTCASYFRFWSWLQDPARTSAPLSADALSTYFTSWSIGSFTGIFGSQAPRIMRKKGIISSRVEYYMDVGFGISFQFGGWFYGLGHDTALIAMTTVESITKIGLYTYARLVPFKGARAIVLHPELAKADVDEIFYNVGIDEREMNSPEKKSFPNLVRRLKEEQTLTWKQKAARKIAGIGKSCQSLLLTSEQLEKIKKEKEEAERE